MLPPREEAALMERLRFGAAGRGEWLRLTYGTHLAQFEHGGAAAQAEELFVALEERHGLRGNLGLLAARAQSYYAQHDARRAYECAVAARALDPYLVPVTLVQVCAMVELKLSNALFLTAHELVEHDPDKGVAWFAVGCYYLLVRKFDQAAQYFRKATTISPGLAAAWMGQGNAFAAQDESEQAMAAYRTASTLFRGAHLPLLCIAIENLKTNDLALAHDLIQQALHGTNYRFLRPLLTHDLLTTCFPLTSLLTCC